MWSLRGVINTPEVPRVYVGSFWEKPLANQELEEMFLADRSALSSEMEFVAKNSFMTRVDEFIRRIRKLRVHMHLIGHFKSLLPSYFGRESKKNEIINNLEDEFLTLQVKYNLPSRDFPPTGLFRSQLRQVNFDLFNELDETMVHALDQVLDHYIPHLLSRFPGLESASA
eukprot:TRINITY_DN3661_c0_g1_i1.p1 TRINITY_DN3661_c0_g1~~TRINITY_DN3661_c0_g1_i1.p1  ORF type:complete len:170 (-),score=10.20 TRINITY_DN3661_c0_g1_i1:61-570(-)